MSEPQLSGSVFIEDANPPVADYTPARKANVTISFATNDPAQLEDLAQRAAEVASSKVAALLGKSPPAAVQPAAAPKAAARSKKADPAPAASSAPSAATAGPVASEPDPFEVAPESPEVAAARAELEAKTGQQQVAEDDEFTVQPAAEVATDDEFALTTAPPKAISDADLNAAVQKKNGEINNSQAIRELIGTFNPDPKRAFQLREITPEQRPVFLEKLAELKKA